MCLFTPTWVGDTPSLSRSFCSASFSLISSQLLRPPLIQIAFLSLLSHIPCPSPSPLPQPSMTPSLPPLSWQNQRLCNDEFEVDEDAFQVRREAEGGTGPIVLDRWARNGAAPCCGRVAAVLRSCCAAAAPRQCCNRQRSTGRCPPLSCNIPIRGKRRQPERLKRTTESCPFSCHSRSLST